ncbi:MAG: ribonuclease R family protein [Acidobacteriota bacterium]
MTELQQRSVKGRISLHARGFGFLRLEPGGVAVVPAESIFLPPPELSGFLAGDLVEAKLVEETDGRFSASELRLLDRPRERLFGIVEGAGKRLRLRPDAEVANETWVLEGGKGLLAGTAVVAKIDGKRAVKPQAVPESERAMTQILARWSLRGAHDRRQSAAAREARARRTPRLDLREVPTVTIDAPVSQDLDDALSVLPVQSDGSIRVLVSIADVDAFVRQGSELDREARARGTSLYLPDRVIPMFPKELSERRASLLPGEERPALSVELRIDPEGRMRAVDLQETLIRSDARVSYDEASAFLDEGREESIPEALRDTLRWLRAAAGRLSAVRAGRGGLSFVREEARMTFDPETAEPAAIEARVETSAHRLVERLMVAANEAVAGWLRKRGLPALYRVHDAPKPDRVRSLTAFAASFGFETAFGPELTPRAFAAFEDQFSTARVGPAMRAVVQKTLGPARYTPVPAPHFGLGAPLYLHFTSPIRRYADLVVHRIVKRHLHGARDQEAEDPSLEALAADLNELAFRTSKAEAERLRMLAARLFAGRIGECFEGNVISVRSFGLIVQLTGLGVTGLVPVESLPGHGWRISPETLELVADNGRQRFAVGSALSVEVRGAEEATGQIELGLAGDTIEGRPRRRSRSRPRRRRGESRDKSKR